MGISLSNHTLSMVVGNQITFITLNHEVVPRDSEVDQALFVFSSFLLVGMWHEECLVVLIVTALQGLFELNLII